MDRELVELHRARQVIYAALAEVFLQVPEASMLQRQMGEKIFGCFPLETNRPEVAEGVACLRQWEEPVAAGSLEEAVRGLRQDYTRLFMGPGRVLAPPWESVYRTEERLLFREPAMQVRNFYRRHGLEVPRLNQEPDDHFGLELAFMAVLAERTAGALEKAGAGIVAVAGGEAVAGQNLAEARYLVEEQHNFLREHLGQWVEPFTLDVERKATTAYYRGIALVTRGFIMDDEEWLLQDILPLGGYR
ncbi:MAG: cytoplasmic chaperone TorD [Clostridia bacterium]|nr:MAG: cytoplasmic chaperone TorD [Clostridia bacterium]